MSYPEELLWDQINDGWDRMTIRQRNLWEAIKLLPQQWQLNGYGLCWVVALTGSSVIFYNHFENGFNRSTWSHFGIIDQYQSMQWNLQEVVQAQLDVIDTGYDVGPRSSGPILGELQK